MDGTFGKAFTATFTIPGALRGEALLGIKLTHNTSGSYGFTMFQNTTGWNSTSSLSLSPVGTSSADSGGNSVSIFQGPTFWIHDVRKDKDITLKVTDFPQSEKYRVTMGKVGTQFQPGETAT